jgi:hypothetical protein
MLSCFAVAAACVPVVIFPSGQASAQRKDSPGRVRVAAPEKQPATAQKVPPELMQVLTEWFAQTRKIERLDGEHLKFTYDYTFNIEKRGTGRFYYETPDKGRIDISPVTISAGAKSEKKDRRGRPFTLQAEREEKWLSNGKNIYHIDPVNKKVIVYPIPDKAQGQNIMDGPLPFLLGMPPQKALARYRLSIMNVIMKDGREVPWNNETEVCLTVHPRWKSDAANYREAKVILKKKNNYLPSAVQLIDPGGNRKTVYTFGNMVVNKNQFLKNIFGQNWLNIDLRGYKIEHMGTSIVKSKAPPKRSVPKDILPSVAGHPVKNAEERLTKLGLKVEFINGRLATKKEEVGIVESQFPAPFTRFKPGQKVVLARYVDPRPFKDASQFRDVPDLKNKHYKEAEKELKKLGFEVEFRKGIVATDNNLTYCVQYQYPLTTGKTLVGTKFILTLYLPKPRTAAKPQ